MRKASFVLGGMLAVAGWLGVAGTLLVVPATAEAQQKVSQKVGVPLKAAQDAIGKKRWDQALGKIREADAAAGKTAFDQYKINEMLWYVYLQQGRNADAARLLDHAGEQVGPGSARLGAGAAHQADTRRHEDHDHRDHRDHFDQGKRGLVTVREPGRRRNHKQGRSLRDVGLQPTCQHAVNTGIATCQWMLANLRHVTHSP